MGKIEFRFKYNPRDGASELDAYDASQALYGISRSLAIFTHYALHRKVIKKAPALKGAEILVRPPRAGSFEFILPIIQVLSENTPQAVIALNLASSIIYDLAKVTYNRLTGGSDKVSSDELRELNRSKPGDLDAIADCVEEDVNRIHRPLVLNVDTINIYGGTNSIADFNQSTADYAKTKIISSQEARLFGHVTSYNGSTVQGRIWIEDEERTIGFSVDKSTGLKVSEKKRLSWSLNQWVNDLEGYIFVRGFPLTSKQGLLKHIFLTAVEKA